MTTAPYCPFCEAQTLLREAHALNGIVEIFDCPACHSHLHKPLAQHKNVARRTTSAKVAQGSQPECPECVFADEHCVQCGDTVCPKHVHQATTVAASLSPELRDHLLEQYGQQRFCPLCFQGKIMRLARDVAHGPSRRNRPRKLFNMPLILILFALVFLITIGPKRCVAEHLSNQDANQHEPNDGNP